MIPYGDSRTRHPRTGNSGVRHVGEGVGVGDALLGFAVGRGVTLRSLRNEDGVGRGPDETTMTGGTTAGTIGVGVGVGTGPPVRPPGVSSRAR